MAVQISHVGLCVSDLERSLRFYVDGLGFEVQETIPCGDEVGPLGEVESPVEMVAQFIAKNGTRVELLAWPKPGVVGEPSRRRNQIGLTHLAMQVDDIEEVAGLLVSLGGTVLEDTRCEIHGIKLLVVEDPDRTRVELMKRPPA